MSVTGGIAIEKLRGVQDYNSWKFQMKMYLIHEDLFGCISSKDACRQCEDVKKCQKTLAKICLSVSAEVLPHVRNASTPLEAWENLRRAFEDRGLCRRLGLLRSLFGSKLKETEGIEKYLARITEISQQLQDIESPLDDEFVAVIMLSGLTSDYDPLIMALENSDRKLSTEAVKTKLLHEVQRRQEKADQSDADVTALVAKKTVLCFRCKKPGALPPPLQ